MLIWHGHWKWWFALLVISAISVSLIWSNDYSSHHESYDTFTKVVHHKEVLPHGVCGDGSWTGSSGSGTCSWHGGYSRYVPYSPAHDTSYQSHHYVDHDPSIGGLIEWGAIGASIFIGVSLFDLWVMWTIDKRKH